MQFEILFVKFLEVHDVVVLVGVGAFLILWHVLVELLAQAELAVDDLELLVVLLDQALVLEDMKANVPAGSSACSP